MQRARSEQRNRPSSEWCDRGRPTHRHQAALCSTQLQDPVGAASFAEEAVTRARDHGLANWEAYAKIVLGWISVRQAGARVSASEIREGMASLQSIGTEVGLHRHNCYVIREIY